MDVRVGLYKESWVPKNKCFWTVVLEKTLESPLDCKEIQPVHPKGNQSWIFIARTDAEAETPTLWSPDVKNWCFWTALEKTPECPLEIQPVNPKGDQSWVFTGRADTEAETLILQPPDARNWLIWKDPDAGKDWKQEEKGMTGWDGWMISFTQWTWVWASSRRWWRTGESGMLQSMGSQRVGYNWATEQQKWNH